MRSLVIPRTLGGRLTVAFIGVVGVAMLALVVVVPELARAHQLRALEGRLADEAQLLADYVATQLAQSDSPDLDALAKRLGRQTQSRYTIIAPDGTVLGESHQDLAQVENHAGRREVQQALAGVRGVDLHRSETVGYEMLYVAVPIRHDGTVVGVARTALPLSEVNRLLADLTQTILIAAAASGLLAVAVAFLAAKAITRPLSQLTQLAAALAADHWHASPIRRGDGPAEVLQLGETLDQMTAAIRESLQRVAAERDRLDTVLANLADGVVIVDGDGRVARLNAAAERLLGIRGLAAEGRTVAEVLRDHELVALVERARTSPELRTDLGALLEWRNPRRYLRAAVSRFGLGDARQLLLVLQDLTEFRRVEAIRRDFAANVSHELRTPIASIKAMVETLQDGAVDDTEAAHDFLDRIQQEVDGLHQLVEELLELSRLESDRVEVTAVPTDPSDLVHSAIRRLAPMAERAKVSLSAELPSDLPPVAADPERMGQVLVNLIHNAIKFTPPGGTIAVRAAAEEERAVRLSVADTGVGIAPEALPRIFERFYKADQARAGGGTGLGLAIAKHIVQLHAGEIWAESAGSGRGTTVHVRLPCATP